MKGLSLGYGVSNKVISKLISTIQGHLVSHPSFISQYIGYGALKLCSNGINTIVNTYKERRDLIYSLIGKIPNISYIFPR